MNHNNGWQLLRRALVFVAVFILGVVSSFAQTLTVTSPSGGERWVMGSTHNITWTSTGTIANVKIEISTDSGVNYETVVASTSNTGSYSMTVPYGRSTQAMIRVSDASNPAVFDVSNGVFSLYSDSKEPNDDSLSAAVLPMGTTGNLIYDGGDNQDTDWYKFFVPPAEAGKDLKVNVHVTSPYPDPVPYPEWASDIDYELLDGYLRVLGVTTSRSDNETIYLHGVASGWYYIYIGYCSTEYADSSIYARYAVTLETGTGFGLGYISGRVVNGSGQGVADEFLLLDPLSSDWSISRAYMTTGTGGNFTIAFTPGTYTLLFNSAGNNLSGSGNYFYASPNVVGEYYNNKKKVADADQISFSSGQTVNLGDVVLDTGAIVSGHVTKPSAAALAGVTVRSYDLEGNTSSYEYVFTAADGSYTLNSVPIGGAKLRFNKSGYATEFYDNKPTPGSADTLPTVAGGTLSGIDVQLGVGGTIPGTVRDGLGAGIGNVRVVLYSVLDGTFARTSIRSESGSGNFSFNRVLPGGYKIYFDTTGLSFTPEWYTDAASFAQATAVTVTEGGTSPGINAVLSPTIISAPITVTSPNGGENWGMGSTHNITWTSTGTIANVQIELSTNNGIDWSVVIASTPNDGSYSWTIPGTPSTSCQICISDVANPPISDYSNTNFAISTAIPVISLSRSALFFGNVNAATGAQAVSISNTGTGTLDWSVESPQTWISVTPSSGTGTAVLTVSVDPPSGLAPGTYTGVVNVMAAGATNSPQTIAVTLKVYAAGASAEPFGSFDTPTSGLTVRGSIPVTGWALDDIEVTNLEVRRDPVVGDPPGAIGADGLVWVGDATFVEGARPDVEAAWPETPLNYRAGWGYMLLTYGLPDHGNGTFVLHAVALDRDGHRKELATKIIVSDNAHNTKPFGAIDTPGQGGTVSGNAYVNFGWVLTPPPAMVPVDGSTIWLWIDSVQVGHPTYNNYRSDIHDAYPAYLNADGAVGFYYVDTTAYANGMHTIGWSAVDDHAQEEGMGSRFFWVFNGSSGAGAAGLPAADLTGVQENTATADLTGMAADVLSPVYVRRGFRDAGAYEVMSPDALGIRNYEIEEVERVVISLDSPEDLPSEGRALRAKGSTIRGAVELMAPARWSGYLVVGKELRSLPIGSTLDPRRGIFYWQPGPGFVGTYQFVFVDGRDGKKKFVTLSVRPKSFSPGL